MFARGTVFLHEVQFLINHATHTYIYVLSMQEIRHLVLAQQIPFSYIFRISADSFLCVTHRARIPPVSTPILNMCSLTLCLCYDRVKNKLLHLAT